MDRPGTTTVSMEPAFDISYGAGPGMGIEPASPPPPAAREDTVRANTYGLLAALLASSPRGELYDLLSGIDASAGGDGLGTAWHVLKLAAERADAAAVDDEYHDLFIGIGRGELIPYGSWYLTGFVMDKPLAVLRADLAALGFERQDHVKEPEDHAAALLETMALIVSSPEHGLDVQRRFFERHVAAWMRTFFTDLQNAGSAHFYRAVGQFGEQFMAFEMQYLSIVV